MAVFCVAVPMRYAFFLLFACSAMVGCAGRAQTCGHPLLGQPADLKTGDALTVNGVVFEIAAPQTCKANRGQSTRIDIKGPMLRRFTLGPSTARDCAAQPHADELCVQVDVSAFNRAVGAALGDRGISNNGGGPSSCGPLPRSTTDWIHGIAIYDWRHADRALIAIVEQMQIWGVGRFSLELKALPCVVPEAQ